MTPHQALTRLTWFFDHLVESDFLETSAEEGARLRAEVRTALFLLLLEHRPFLETAKGLDWPYRRLRAGGERLAAIVETDPLGPDAQSALRFLALLPFPGQWSRLRRMIAQTPDDPEVAAFVRRERDKISRKIKKKRQKTFYLRHFCQILKPPRPPEVKGVLRIFSLPYLFFTPGLVETLGRHYLLYVEPPWGVLARHAWLRKFASLDDPTLFGVGGAEDAAFLSGQNGVRITRLAHGDFLDPSETVPLNRPKTHDILFNATFDEPDRKRHHLMLDLMRHPSLADVTVLFIGRGGPAAVAAFKDAVRRQGLCDRATVMANLMRKDVPEMLARCRMGVQVSLHENVCRSIYECFRSDLPCVLSSSMAGMDFSIITPETGAVATDETLPQTIAEVLHHRERLAPRKWFLEHSGSLNNTPRLNAVFKDLFHERGYFWHEDIAPLDSSGANRYLHPQDYERFRDDFKRLHGLFMQIPNLPIRLVPDESCA